MQIPFLASLLSQHSGSTSNTQPSPAAAASSTPTSGSGSAASAASSASGMGITANDFLSLLVTEMKNQDPTQQTDPMTYITQLVGVNSLEQLVQINQDLTPTSSGTTPTGHAVSAVLPTDTTPVSAAANAATLAVPGGATLSLPPGGHIPMSSNASLAISQAFESSPPMASQAAPAQLSPSQVAIQPEALRAIQMSIPGATLTSASNPATGTAGGGLP